MSVMTRRGAQTRKGKDSKHASPASCSEWRLGGGSLISVDGKGFCAVQRPLMFETRMLTQGNVSQSR